MGMSITPNRQPTPDRGRRQRGQSSVFVIVFLGITILSLVFLYKAGKLTSEKMELQNAADGVAYSVAILEARDLNFMAYTNRAMVANEVAIGQAVGLASWPRHWESIGYYENAVCGGKLEPAGFWLEKGGKALKQASAAFILPPLIAIAKTIGTVAEKTGTEIVKACESIRGKGIPPPTSSAKKDLIARGKALRKAVDKDIAKPLAQLMQGANQGLSDAQAIFHLGTIAYVVKIISQVTQDNVTDNSPGDTGLSPYGLAALIGHLYSFGHLAPYGGSTPAQRYGPDPNRQDKPFIRTYRPGSGDSADRTGFERLAAITGAARDEFGKGPRRWVARPDFRPDMGKTLEFPLGICPGPPFITCFGWLRFVLTFKKGLTTPIDHRAGSELRYVNNGQGDQYNWSSGDTSVGDIQFSVTIGASLDYAPPKLSGKPSYSTILGATGDVSIGTGGFQMGMAFTILGTTFPINISFGDGIFPGLPFGAGAAQINNGLNNWINPLTSMGELAWIAPFPVGTSDYWGHAPPGSSVTFMDTDAHRWGWAGLSLTGLPSFPGPGLPPGKFPCPTSKAGIPAICFVPTVSGIAAGGVMPISNVGGLVGGLLPGGTYTGLKQYSDTTTVDDLWGFEGPHIIIALQKQITDIFSATAPQPTGRFNLTESSNTNNVIGAIAKGEVYFKRPSNMDLFRRWDTPKASSGNSDTLYEEYGSAFNPYWQARLAPLSHADRVVATAQQHGQDLESGSNVASTITASWELDTWIN